MIYTIKRKAYLSRQTHINLSVFLRHLTDLYNAGLQERIDCYQKTGKTLSFYDQCKSMKIVREDKEYKKYNAQCQRSPLKTLDESYKSFFRRIKKGDKPGFPRFKGRYSLIESFVWNQPIIKDNYVEIKGVGKFKFKGCKPKVIKNIRIVKKKRRVEIQFVCDIDKAIDSKGGVVGIDMGVAKRMVLSTGEEINKNIIDRAEFTKRQQILSRAKKGSNNRHKKKISLAKIHEKINEKQKNAIHRETTNIVKKHSKIFIEDLNIKEMITDSKISKNMNKNILAQSWRMLADQLTYKAENAGGFVVRVNPKNTSKMCSSCGHIDKTLTLNTREYTCGQCGLYMDRDRNASINILKRGLSTLSGGLNGKNFSVPDAQECLSRVNHSAEKPFNRGKSKTSNNFVMDT